MTDKASADITTGRCLCGSVTYAASTAPFRTTICYCRFCQRATGAPVMILPVLNAEDFRVANGEPKVFTHVSEGSGKEVYVHYCKDCGTKLFVRLARFEGMVGLYAGTMDDMSLVPLDAANAKQIFVGSAQPDTVIKAGLPTYKEHVIENDGTPNTPVVLDHPLRADEVRFD